MTCGGSARSGVVPALPALALHRRACHAAAGVPTPSQRQGEDGKNCKQPTSGDLELLGNFLLNPVAYYVDTLTPVSQTRKFVYCHKVSETEPGFQPISVSRHP